MSAEKTLKDKNLFKQYLDLQRINNSFEPELSDSLKRVSHSGWYLFGNEVKNFESEFSVFRHTKQKNA